MHKSKPIAKDSRAGRRTEHARGSSSHFLGGLAETPHLSLRDERYTVADFLLFLQLEQPPYYLDHSFDPYFDPDDHADPPTAPLRARPCIDRINQQFLERLGGVPPARPLTVTLHSAVRVKYFSPEDAASCVRDYEENVEMTEEEAIIQQEEAE